MVDKIWYNMEELIGGSEERVLIETYWNVNSFTLIENSFTASVLIETYWNVNKVRARDFEKFGFVLIETYWNVNLTVNSLRLAFATRINRNILECK